MDQIKAESLSDLDHATRIMNDNSSHSDNFAAKKKFNQSKRFWAIMATLSVTGILSALENTVVTTALPYITQQLDLGDNYVWVTNVFFLTGAAVQPLFGQLANIFGRRWVTMVIVFFFTLGSGICGGATNGAMLIAGRAVQGIGAGGINIIIDIIVSDLVPLRERGNYMAIVLLVYTVGTALGPWVGGEIVAHTSWRWVFWINLPVGGTAMIMIFFFLQVQYNKEMSFFQKMKRIDFGGNLILVGATVSILYALTYGGTRYVWSSANVVTPLIIGFAGLGIFMWFETTKWAKEPVIPPRLFANQTSCVIFGITFLNSALLYWVLFFLPVYFQTVLGSSAARAGVQILPSVLIAIPGAIVAVLLLAKFGKYKPLHMTGFAICTIGLGLFTLFGPNTTTAEWVIFQAITAAGSGFVLNTLLPSVQAHFEEKDQAATTAAWSFMRAFGSIWGVAIPAAIFNNRFSQLSSAIANPQARAMFEGGGVAYERAQAELIWSFPQPTRDEIIGVYSDSLQRVWQISIVFSGLSFLLVFLEKQIKLRTNLETEFGIEGSQKKHGIEVGER
ncbi:multidrug resistance protein fnx1 [Daldinia grandis]|nr:multidrug resistance protein fnx1 [Daldinia grandis]